VRPRARVGYTAYGDTAPVTDTASGSEQRIQLDQELPQAEGGRGGGGHRDGVPHGREQQRGPRVFERVRQQQIPRLIHADGSLDEAGQGGHGRHGATRPGGEHREGERGGVERNAPELAHGDQGVLARAQRESGGALGVVDRVEREAGGVGDAAEAGARVNPDVEQRILDLIDDWIGSVVVDGVELQHSNPNGT
jgi:hypothetical protein